MTMHKSTKKKAGLAAVAVLGLAGCGLSLATAGLLPVNADANPALEDKATQQQVTIDNTTNEDLTLVSAAHSGSGVHWHAQPQATLKAGTSEVVTDYGAGDNTITITYKGATTGSSYEMKSYVDFANPEVDDSCTTSTTPSDAGTIAPFTVNATTCGSGDNLHSTFTVAPGTGIVAYTGKPLSYTVPAGYSKLSVVAVGGNGYQDSPKYYGYGAQVEASAAVTPGEALTVGVGDNAQGALGGWGMSYNGSSFSGGNGVNNNLTSGGGGGASAVIGTNSDLVVVAGGAGGQGNASAEGHSYTYGYGGQGGAGPNNDGSGFDGDPDGLGGKAASSGSTQGQSVDEADSSNPGGGGGGWEGGSAGMAGSGGGGGAGSSYTSGVLNQSITTTGAYPGQPDGLHAGYVVLTLSN
jgi:hypothetical protein